MTKRATALAALRARLAQIRIANGFTTDAGAKILFGEDPVVGPSDPPAVLAIVVGDTSGETFEGEVIPSSVPVSVQVIAPAGLGDPGLTIEAILGDIKTAVELTECLPECTGPLGIVRDGTTWLKREPGEPYIGAAVNYRILLREGWGAP